MGARAYRAYHWGVSAGDDPSCARIVLITHPEDGARDFARSLVERRLAACVNLLPVTSVYTWQGAIEEDPEVLLVVKTSATRLAELEGVLAEGHPYDVPECVALTPAHVAPAYLDWLLTETREAGHDRSESAKSV